MCVSIEVCHNHRWIEPGSSNPRSTGCTLETRHSGDCNSGVASTAVASLPCEPESGVQSYRCLVLVSCAHTHSASETLNPQPSRKHIIRRSLKKMLTNILHPRSRNHGSESHHELEGSVLSSNHAGFPKRNASVVHGNPQTVSAEFDCHDAYHRNPCETPVSFNQVSIIARNPASHGPYPLVVDTDTARQTQPCMTPSSLSSNTSVTISSFGSRRSSSQTANTHYSPCSFSAVSSQQTYSPVKRDDCFSDSSPSKQYFPQYAVNPYQQTFSHNCLAGGYQHFQHWASGSTADAYPTPPPATASLAELNGLPVDIPELPGHIAELDPAHVASQLPGNLVPVNSEEIAQASFNGMNDAETANYSNNEKVVIDESWWYRPRSHIVYTPKSDILLEGEGGQLCGIPSLDNSSEVDQNYGENTTLSPPSRPPSKKRKGKTAGKNSNTPPRSQDRSECNECNQQFTGDYQIANLRRHIRSFHWTGEENKCSYCDRTYKRSDAKRKHEWKKHRAEDARPQKRRSEKRDSLTYF